MSFNALWDFIFKRRPAVVQERSEMEYIYNLIKQAQPKDYLEIGTAEGDSMLVFGGLADKITYIDLCETHTTKLREDVVAKLRAEGKSITEVKGNSTSAHVIDSVKEQFDIVYIDGGHDYDTVLSDCIHFAPLARKYVIWHDIQIPDVKKAVSEYLYDEPYETFINSDNYGYAIWKVGK